MRSHDLYPIRLECLKCCLLFGPIIFLAIDLLPADAPLGLWLQVLGFLLAPVGSTLVRKKTGKIRSFLIGSLPLFLYVLLLSLEGIVFLYLIETSLLCVYGYFRLKRADERPLGYLYLGFSLGITAILSMANQNISFRYLIGSFVYVILFLLYQHRTALYDALIDRDSKELIGSKQTLRINRRMFILFIFVFLVFCGILLTLGIQDVLEKWLHAVLLDLLVVARKAFRSLFKIRVRLKMFDQDEELLQKQAQSHQALDAIPATKMGTMLLRFTLFIGAIVLLTALIYFFVRLIRTLQKKKVTVDPDYWEEKVFLKSTFSTRVIRRKRMSQEPLSEIRRRYRRIVAPQIGSRVDRSDTVNEVARKVPQIAKIQQEYEKARYG